MRAVGYLRVSSEEQVDGWSLDAQRKAFEEFCESRGWDAVRTYADEGESAWTDSMYDRPQFSKMLEDAKGGKFDVVITHTLDRFTRNVWVMLQSLRVLADANVTFVSVQEQIDYTRPEGKLFLLMVSGFAQYFSDALSGHIRKGMKERASSGLYNGEPPFGYERCTEDCGVGEGHAGAHVVEWKGALVRELFKRYAAGNTTCGQLAEWLNDRGATTNNRRPFVDGSGETVRGGRKFSAHAVKDILHNQFYLGRVKYKGEWYQGAHQPLVDEGLYQTVQDEIAKKRNRPQGKKPGRKAYLLAGLARCVHCGFTLWGESAGRNSTSRYQERAGSSGRSCSFNIKKSMSIREGVVEPQVAMIFKHFKLHPNWKKEVVKRLEAGPSVDEAGQKKVRLERSLARTKELYMEGDLNREEYQRRKNHLLEQIESCVVPEVNAVECASQLVEDTARLWQESSTAQRNSMLRAMMDAVYLDTDSGMLVGIKPKAAFREVFLSVYSSDMLIGAGSELRRREERDAVLPVSINTSRTARVERDALSPVSTNSNEPSL